MPEYFIHETAEISKGAKIGKNTKIWHQSQVREEAEIGENCIISKCVYIDFGVKIGIMSRYKTAYLCITEL